MSKLNSALYEAATDQYGKKIEVNFEIKNLKQIFLNTFLKSLMLEKMTINRKNCKKSWNY
jgi:hypothetical protein